MGLISEVKSKIFQKKSNIQGKIQELEALKVKQQEKVDREFDRMAEAELEGKDFDDSLINKLSIELQEISGKIAAYTRQLEKANQVTNQDKQLIIEGAAEQYKQICINELTTRLRLIEIDHIIRDLLAEVKKLEVSSGDEEIIFSRIETSGLFDGEDIKNIVKQFADITNDKQYTELSEQIKQRERPYPYNIFIWNKNKLL